MHGFDDAQIRLVRDKKVDFIGRNAVFSKDLLHAVLQGLHGDFKNFVAFHLHSKRGAKAGFVGSLRV